MHNECFDDACLNAQLMVRMKLRWKHAVYTYFWVRKWPKTVANSSSSNLDSDSSTKLMSEHGHLLQLDTRSPSGVAWPLSWALTSVVEPTNRRQLVCAY